MKIKNILLLSLLAVTSVYADNNAQANNPLANMTAFNVQNYYVGELTDSDESANQAWARFAQPFSVAKTDWLLRISLPLNTFPTAPNGDKETGLGDLNIFAAYLIDTGNPAVSFGVGPQVTLPTATKDALGSEKYSAGLVNVLFDASSSIFQYGYLLSWEHSFAGEASRQDVNVAALQPFAMYQVGGGTYLRAAPIWVYDIEGDTYSMPVGVGVGHVIKRDKTVYNMFIEPQYSVVTKGSAQSQWQVYMGLNLQFLE